ncbi:MAG TPA: FGGY-family carbohydrate kinase [Acidimicrobiales bacterium]|nr:FGGY-family carbohydrate kinase [Acidimicrobiales bacterium]
MSPGPRSTVTAGIDIGTTSVKAVAVDEDGVVLARSRVPHEILVPGPELMEHDADRAWRRGPKRALAALGSFDVKAVGIAAMVPSMTAVDRRGRPLTPGLLYGDARGRSPGGTERVGSAGPEGSGEAVGFLRWTSVAAPDAAGYWHAQAVATKAFGGPPAVDFGVAFTSSPLYGPAGWDESICGSLGVDPARLPRVELPGAAVGRMGRDGPVLAAGAVDVWCEQLVAGASEAGDVHVICGTSLIVWAVVPKPVSAPGLWCVGSAKGGHIVGGASNAGGLFLDWASRLMGGSAGRKQSERSGQLDPANIPVWAPYPRGERTPYHDPRMRASLHGLNLTHGPAAVRRAAWEASGFVVRHHLELAGVKGKRLVLTGGGTKVPGWVQALADVTGLPAHVAADPEGAARGAAFLGRVAAGLEAGGEDAERWARTGRVVEPDPRWAFEADTRYAMFLEHSGRLGR